MLVCRRMSPEPTSSVKEVSVMSKCISELESCSETSPVKSSVKVSLSQDPFYSSAGDSQVSNACIV